MTEYSVQAVWDKFERWASRYEKVSFQAIDEILDTGYLDFDDCLFLLSPEEVHNYESSMYEPDLAVLITAKINFLRGYLVFISYDGAEFMDKHSRFLTNQYPSKCENSMGIWFEQSMEGDIEAGGYHGFQGFKANLFCNSIKDIDLATVKAVLPFSQMLIRQVKGQKWDEQSVKCVLEQISDDLGFDYEVKIKSEWSEKEQLLIVYVDFD